MQRREFGLTLGALVMAVGRPSDAAERVELVRAPRSRQITATMARFYANVKTFSAEFTQRSVQTGGGTTAQRGVVFFEKPSKFSWRYSATGNRVVYDGKFLKVYEPTKQRISIDATDMAQPAAALSFLSSQSSLWDHQPSAFVDAKQIENPRYYVIVSEPLCSDLGYEVLRLHVDSKTFKVRRVDLRETGGHWNTTEFERARLDPEMPWRELTLDASQFVTVVRGSTSGRAIRSDCGRRAPLF